MCQASGLNATGEAAAAGSNTATCWGQQRLSPLSPITSPDDALHPLWLFVLQAPATLFLSWAALLRWFRTLMASGSVSAPTPSLACPGTAL